MNEKEDQNTFTKMVDDLVEFGEFDPDLKDGLKWVDKQARKKGITFYEMVFRILENHELDERAKEWRKRDEL